MKQNRPLLILLAILIAIPSAMVLPDYFSCNPLHWVVKSDAEAAIETQERDDVRRAIEATGTAAYFEAGPVDYHALTLVVKADPPDSAEWPKKMIDLFGAWEQSYASRHGSHAPPCLTIVAVDTHGNVIGRSVNRDSVYRQLVDEGLW